MSIPTPGKNWALFLDIDGTLLDIAPSPDKVEVPATLVPTLSRASDWLGGALALASGRTLAEINALMDPLKLPCVAEHGAILRRPDGTIVRAGPEHAVPGAWRERLRAAARDWPGVMVEEKDTGVAVHYRLAPAREAEVRDLVLAVAAENPAAFEVLPARKAFEIRHRALTKALAVTRFMPQPPFAGRVPVFVGDDVTDEDGFSAAVAMGGLALNVADVFGGQPARVRDWLATFSSSAAS
ncbi:MAG TPA: trehalose-phosphatase [Caulobacteraceae bacterium]|nr:trehalose-phosphatase [Caulobacteraceae bacterium]